MYWALGWKRFLLDVLWGSVSIDTKIIGSGIPVRSLIIWRFCQNLTQGIGRNVRILSSREADPDKIPTCAHTHTKSRGLWTGGFPRALGMREKILQIKQSQKSVSEHFFTWQILKWRVSWVDAYYVLTNPPSFSFLSFLKCPVNWTPAISDVRSRLKYRSLTVEQMADASR